MPSKRNKRKPNVEITIGADPEVFLQRESDNDYFPAIGLVGGSKEEPNVVDSGALQEDNVMAEFNITPASTEDQFVENVERVMEQLAKVVAQHGLRLSPVHHAAFNPKYLKNEKAMMFGCDPDFNIYTRELNDFDSMELLINNERVAGGHVHIGIIESESGEFALDADPQARVRLAQACELFIGLPSVLVDPDKERKKFYGRAGAHRIKPYGIEYRVLSNFWVKSQDHMRWVYNAAREAARWTMRNPETVNRVFTEFAQNNELADVINTKNKEGVYDFYEQFPHLTSTYPPENLHIAA